MVLRDGIAGLSGLECCRQETWVPSQYQPLLTAIQALFLIYEIKGEIIPLKHVRIKWDNTHKTLHIVPDMFTQ